MISRFWRALQGLRAHAKGNATLLLAVGMPALIGGAGLAVDTAQWYMWKRELQHAVDQSAIGAAWARSDSDRRIYYQVRGVQEFNANKRVTSGLTSFSSSNITLENYAGGVNNSVVVIASATKRLPFSSFLTGRATTVRARAQARFREGATYQACLVALSDTSSAIDIGGSAIVRAQCGLAALSCEPNAVTISSSASVTTDSIATCGTVDAPSTLDGVIDEGVTGLSDYYADLEPPTNNTARTYACATTGTGRNRSTQANLQPGTYAGLVVSCTTVLNPGIYVIDGGVLDLAANYNVTGSNVMFVLKGGARLKFGGNGNSNRISLTPMQAADFIGTPYASLADRYAGMLVFEDRNNNPANPGHQMNGNSTSIIEGLIYLPDGEMTVLGTADIAAQCLQISAWKITISGNAELETLCPASSTTSAGTAPAEVRLVG